ncbi:hypothetical protein [Rheinheimera aquimaris]|uniref:hypothetical protein n=1 Tax=Rheinheimera aquimaris TaxID=412437 RepID=UPI001E51602C|nr:hypothetical protein [Rheinheimera aquimaris]MCD1598215.1 hypothetical protein [Rheinheimera aquimaris]
MGRMSDLMIDMANESADDWINERLEDKNADEDSEEYRYWADQYYALQEHLHGQAELEFELKWLKEHGSSEIHKIFIEELHELKKIIGTRGSVNKPYLILRMAYSYAVTLLETFLSDSIKSLVTSDDKFFKNALKVDELSKAKYSLEFLALNEMNAKGLAVKELSSILYHNIPKVIRTYEAVLGKRLNIDMSQVDVITKIRHDIVHRNGKTKDGTLVHIDEEKILASIESIEIFAKELQLVINKNT